MLKHAFRELDLKTIGGRRASPSIITAHDALTIAALLALPRRVREPPLPSLPHPLYALSGSRFHSALPPFFLARFQRLRNTAPAPALYTPSPSPPSPRYATLCPSLRARVAPLALARRSRHSLPPPIPQNPPSSSRAS